MTVALAGSVGLAAAGSSAAYGAASGPSRIRVANAQPRLARATVAGAPSRSQKITVKLYLAGQRTAELQKVIADVSTPSSKNYGKYLTAAQFRARYSPSTATVGAVRSFLTGAHLQVTAVPANRSYVAATGTVADVQQAFATTLKTYRQSGRTFRAAASAPSIPRTLQDKVTAVAGLASLSSLVTPNHVDGPAAVSTSKSAAKSKTAAKKQAPPPDAFVNARPCSAYYGEKAATDTPPAYGTTQPYAPCGYTPAQLQGAYGLTAAVAHGVDGKGVTVAITDAYAAPTILSDANTYATQHGQPAFRRGQFTQVLPSSYQYGYDDTVNGDLCGEQGWYGEETLDVEAVHAVAPGAKVTYVASPSCDNGDFLDTLIKVVDGHLADIVTNSWGGTDETNGSPELDAAYEATFEQAAATGIGFYFSSGDAGDGRLDPADPTTATVQAPANSPYVTAVGGTSLAVGAKNQRLWETGWSTSRSVLTAGAWTPTPPGTYQYGAGGGTSRVFAQPAYQRGVVPDSLSKRYSATPARVVPDISTIGDPNTGFLVGETQTFPDGTAKYSEYRIGGTSLASPVMAGIMAVADQVAHHPHGFANPALYTLYKIDAKGLDVLYDPKPVTGVGVVRVDYINAVDATDGTRTSLRTIDATNGTILRAAPGYDDITGVGTPKGLAFLAALAFLK